MENSNNSTFPTTVDPFAKKELISLDTVKVPFILKEQLYAHVYENASGVIRCFVMREFEYKYDTDEPKAVCILAVENLEKGVLYKFLRTLQNNGTQSGARHNTIDENTNLVREVFKNNNEDMMHTYDADDFKESDLGNLIASLNTSDENPGRLKVYTKRMSENATREFFCA